MEGRKISNKLN